MCKMVPVSLILTILNEAETLPRFLRSLDRQSAAPAELVVTDAGSTDGSVEMLERWRSSEGIEVKVISTPGASIAIGRNEAARHARHDILAVTDGGTELERDWLKNLYLAIQDGVDVASGFFDPRGEGLMHRIIAANITPHEKEIDPDTFLPSSRSLALKKEFFEKVGGYPEWLDYSEDVVFDLALKRAGACFRFVPKARVTWDARPTVRAYFKQYYRYGRGDAKAGIRSRTHFARFAIYAVGFCALLRSFLPSRRLLTLSVSAFLAMVYFGRYWVRVWRGRKLLGRSTPLGLLMTPVLTLTGDIARMSGYAAGTIWRWRRHNNILK